MPRLRDENQPLPVWLSIPGILAQGVGIFVLPFVVGIVAAMFFEVSEVAETFPAMIGFTVCVLFPISLAQLLGLVLKSRREIRFFASKRELSFTRLCDVLFKHVQVVTLRGWTLLIVALMLTLIALGLKWASFGLLAVLGLLIFYVITGWTIFVSTFLVRTFEVGLERNASGITRQVIPAVCVAGDTVEEVFRFRRVRVPLGYTLLVEEPLPFRLRTESRYSVGPAARAGEVETRGRLRATPRGFYRLGPARLWFQDLLGITRVSVASVATAQLKVLPRFKAVEIIDPPRTPQEVPDVVTRPHRYATEDHFRFREYAAGDDTRRIHWRLSLKAGRLQVRLPENREINAQDILLVLDTYLPPGRLLEASHGADEILDRLVDAWLGIARELIERGNKVTLVGALAAHDRDAIDIEHLACRRGESARWLDMGARVRWQGRYELPQMLAECGDKVHGVVVTARFTAPPPGKLPGQDMTWLFMDPAQALGPAEPPWWHTVVGLQGKKGGAAVLAALNWLFRLPHPAGAEENSGFRRAQATWQVFRLWNARRELRIRARTLGDRTLGTLIGRGDAVYRVESLQTHVRLVGLQGQRGGTAAAAK